MDWQTVAARAEARYRDGGSRLPSEPDRRQKQLVRMAMAAGAAGLARKMQGRREDSASWFRLSAERYRESWLDAPPGSWGRPVGALKARLLAGDRKGAEEDARWVLSLAPQEAASPIATYALALGALILDRDAEAAAAAGDLTHFDAFPQAVAEALRGLSRVDAAAYRHALGAVLESFESRDAYLEDVPVADTVLVLEALAEGRRMAVRPVSPLLP